ncbi:MAG: hypothetical protein WCG34_11325 [Leptolinea sp.]
MILREKELFPETVGDLKAALADCPDDMEIFDAVGETVRLCLNTYNGKPVIVFD